MAKIYTRQMTHQKIIEVLQNLIDQFRKLNLNTEVDSFLIEKISSFEMNMLDWLTLQELEEKTPR